MKRCLLFCIFCLSTLGLFAQRVAVMEFKAGVGIYQSDVDGISAIFVTYFRPAGCTMVERTQIDQVIEEQGFQRSRLTESQMVQIGRILNVSKIVIGDVNVIARQYNVDVRVISVESGTIAATEGAAFTGESYRECMKSVAQKLANKIAVSTKSGVNGSSSNQSISDYTKKRTSVETVYGYLRVFPNELGVFQSAPNGIIANINAQKMHGYNHWRLPTNEELSLLYANGYLSGAQYMSKEKNSGVVLLVDTGMSEAERLEEEAIEAGKKRQAELERQRKEELERKQKEELERKRRMKERKESVRRELLDNGVVVDLGLQSGTLWYAKNEGDDNRLYTFNEAIAKFGNKLPTNTQIEELMNSCTWTWLGSGYKVVGPNGNFIYLSAAGIRSCSGSSVSNVDSYGYYWSFTPHSSERANLLYFFSNKVNIFDTLRCFSCSVRLVHDE